MSAACNCCAWGIVLLQLYDAATTYTPCPCLMLCCPPRAGKRDTLAGLRPGSSKMSMAMGSGMRHLHETPGAHQSCWDRAAPFMPVNGSWPRLVCHHFTPHHPPTLPQGA